MTDDCRLHLTFTLWTVRFVSRHGILLPFPVGFGFIGSAFIYKVFDLVFAPLTYCFSNRALRTSYTTSIVLNALFVLLARLFIPIADIVAVVAILAT